MTIITVALRLIPVQILSSQGSKKKKCILLDKYSDTLQHTAAAPRLFPPPSSNDASETDTRSQNVNQTNQFLLKKKKPNKRASTRPIQVGMTTQRRRAFFIQGTSAALWKISASDVEGSRKKKKTGVLSAFVGRGLICCVSLSSHLLDSISSSVTSAD